MKSRISEQKEALVIVSKSKSKDRMRNRIRSHLEKISSIQCSAFPVQMRENNKRQGAHFTGRSVSSTKCSRVQHALLGLTLDWLFVGC